MKIWVYICLFILTVNARHIERSNEDKDLDTLLKALRNFLPEEYAGEEQKHDGETDVGESKQQNKGHLKRKDDSTAEQHINEIKKQKIDPDDESTSLFSSFLVNDGMKEIKAKGINPEGSKYNQAEKLDKHILTHEQKVEFGMESETEGETNKRSYTSKRAFTTGRLWTDQIVPYEVEASLSDHADALEVIEQAKEEFSSKTCIQWLPHTAELEQEVGHNSYVSFFSGSGCWSFIGFTGKKKQELSLGYPGCVKVGTALHEMLHSLGTWHEQSRTDRDLHVRFNWTAFGGEGGVNYGKAQTRNYYPYDYESVIHYAWRKGFQPLQPELGFLAYKGRQLSYYDIADITAAYRCTDHCVNPLDCENGAFLNFECSCYCPYGLTGTTCNDVINSEVCGGIIDLIPGQDVTITSPNYPNNYDVDTECVWLLRAPKEFHVRVDADVFHLPYDPDTDRCYHWLEVRYNLVGQTGIRVCGEANGDEWVTSPWGEKNLMLLIFDSVYAKLHFPEKGFSLRAKAVQGGCIVNQCKYGVCRDCDDQDYKCECDPGFEGEYCDQVQAAIPLECTFEDDGKCFLQNIKSDQFDWKVFAGPTMSERTGPERAVKGQNYMYAEASTPRVQGDRAILQSNVTFTAEDRCLTFYYHMFGDGIGSLKVRSSSQELWSRSGYQGSNWLKAKVNVPSTENLQLVIEAERGIDWEGDIAIDEIKLSPGECSGPEPDCLSSGRGTDYIGTVNVTQKGFTCQRWDSNEPHRHGFHDYDKYENYCRNTAGNRYGPWCFTMNPKRRWDYCDIPYCHIQECMRSKNGYDYMGSKSVTSQGLQCNKDELCRAKGNAPAPWCHTTEHSDHVTWDTCDIQKCDDHPKECLQTVKGIDYFGTVSVTESDSTCQRWDSQEPVQHSFWLLADQENYCRNPNGSPKPWCWSSVPGEGKHYCDIPYCESLGCSSNPCLHGATCQNTENGRFECQCRDGYQGDTCQTREIEDCRRTATGWEYKGKISVTKSNITCQRWDSDTPHKHIFKTKLGSEENYCRNPHRAPHPWCLTVTSRRWEACDVPFCTTPAKECRETENGFDYFGQVNNTVNGYTCQKWSETTPHRHGFNWIADQGNYCRNPRNDAPNPWCFTTDPKKRWDKCDIPPC